MRLKLSDVKAPKRSFFEYIKIKFHFEEELQFKQNAASEDPSIFNVVNKEKHATSLIGNRGEDSPALIVKIPDHSKEQLSIRP